MFCLDIFWILLKQLFLSPSWALSQQPIRPSALWAIDSQPIWARGIIVNYYIDKSVLLENTPLVNFMRNYIRDSSGIFSVFSLMKISSLSLKLYLNSLVYDRNIFGSSSKVFGHLRKFSENVRERSSGLRNNFEKSSGIFGKSSNTPSLVCLQ